jgi:hypothetical protein
MLAAPFLLATVALRYLKGADMADAGAQKSKADNVDPKDEKKAAASGASELVGEQVVEDLDAGAAQDQDEVRETEFIEQQNLNQGSDTGTHDSGNQGINWGDDYKVREQGTHKILRGNTPDEPPKK